MIKLFFDENEVTECQSPRVKEISDTLKKTTPRSRYITCAMVDGFSDLAMTCLSCAGYHYLSSLMFITIDNMKDWHKCGPKTKLEILKLKLEVLAEEVAFTKKEIKKLSA